MSKHLIIAVCFVLTILLSFSDSQAQATMPIATGKVYELRLYTAAEGKLPDLHARFRDHTVKLLARHGMESLYYWTISEGATADGEDAKNMLVYILVHKSRESADASWAAFRADPDWVTVKQESEKNGPLLSKPVISVFMAATDFSAPDEPANGTSDSATRLFELRKYNTGEAGLPATVSRFREWEAALFAKHGMPPLGMWAATDHSAFIYLLAHSDRETSRRSWEGFFADFRARGNASATAGGTSRPAARRGGAGGTRGGGGGSEIRFLVPTDYSPRK